MTKAEQLQQLFAKERRDFNEYLRSLAEYVGVDMEEFDLPAAHGNDRLRWAVLISEALNAKVSHLEYEVERLRGDLDAHRALLLRLANEAHMRQDYHTNEEICRLLGVPSALEHEKGDL